MTKRLATQVELGSGREEAPAAAAAPGAGAHSTNTATAASSARARGSREVERIRGVGGSSVVAPPERESSLESGVCSFANEAPLLFRPVMRPTKRGYSHTIHASCRAVAPCVLLVWTCAVRSVLPDIGRCLQLLHENEPRDVVSCLWDTSIPQPTREPPLVIPHSTRIGRAFLVPVRRSR
jgi:hypothetical protein